MQKASDLFIQNIKNLPIWAKQVISNEVLKDMTSKLEEFEELIQVDTLFQYLQPKATFKGKQELQDRNMQFSDGYYVFLQDIIDEYSIFDITIKNNWTLADSAKIFIRLLELEYLSIPNYSNNKNVAVAMYIAGKLKTGEFLKRIGRIDVMQLEQAIRYQKDLNAQGRHIKMATVLIKMGFITNKGLDSLLLLKEEAKKRLPVEIGLTSMKYDSPQEIQDQTVRMQREIARLESENAIMKKRLKKLINING